MPRQNLSEKLFKPQYKVPETSTLVRCVGEDNQVPIEGAWYRHLRRAYWAWLGTDPVEVEQILARIAASDNPRSEASWLDTVIGDVPGNWGYEWNQQAMAHQKLAIQAKMDEDRERAKQEQLKASLYFSIAGFPHIKGDVLATKSETLAQKAYKEAMTLQDYPVKQLEWIYQGKTIQATLHLTTTERTQPVAIICGGLDSLQSDYWQLFEHYLAPAGIAMLTLDMPSMGTNQSFSLTQDTSHLHQSLLDYLPEVPWVDHHQVFAFGFRFGGNVAARLAFMAPSQLKGVVVLQGMFHHLLANAPKHWPVPQMYLDIFASRMGVQNIKRDSLLRQLPAWSLKTQGLLSGRATSVPILALGIHDDLTCPKSDLDLLARASQKGTAKMVSKQPLLDAYDQCIATAIDWCKSFL
ncbi:hypothetical protein VST7929_01949 [Vibrio stylophorae]|uniref:Esterase FrsA n=1 Tax=Vibrio stylophorae TaxID=659351 RepID=A0ABN8DUP8_9VIBR|nr:esterase FrsA [Vibrio stylophorae]CAH0534048.1 hypothetical protein VST7929_01949 [Vibrio stylophorae]